MPRSVNSAASKARRKKILKQAKGFYGKRKNVYTVAKNVVEKGMTYMFVGRKLKKRTYRQLWIARINAAVREEGLTYSEFIISRSEKGFRIRTGLINKKEKFVPFSKVQFVSWKANWIRQRIGLFMMQFHATGADHLKNKMQVKVPVTRPAFIPKLLDSYHEILSTSEMAPVKVHKKYIIRRVFLFGVIPAALALPILYFYFGKKALIVLVWVFIVWLTCWLFQRKFRLWQEKEALQIRKGIFGRHELILKWNKIQSVHLQQSIYQRSHKLATIELYTAGGVITIPYVMLEQARQILNFALYKIESSAEPWS